MCFFTLCGPMKNSEVFRAISGALRYCEVLLGAVRTSVIRRDVLICVEELPCLMIWEC